MTLPIYQIDAFTSKLFAGNPAAICPLTEWIPPELMQQIAAENNLAETAFFVQRANHYEIRWFMPHDEIDLCGHATLASAYVIFQYLNPALKEVSFTSQSGILKASRSDNNTIVLDFPARMPTPREIPEEVFTAFHHRPLEAHFGRDLLLLFESEQQIRELNPNLSLLKHLPYLAIIATAKGEEADFVSRVFDANCTIPEDPVTGSAHCVLIPFWAARMAKTKFRALQLSERGGELFCELKGDRVLIGGHAVSFLKGEIEVDAPDDAPLKKDIISKFGLTEKLVIEIASSLDAEMKCYVDRKTKELHEIFVNDEYFSDFDEDQEMKKLYDKLEENEDNYLVFEKMSSSESFGVMERFANQMKDARFQDELFKALNQRKPFRNFKNTVDYSEYREDWFAFKAKEYQNYVINQLEIDF